MDPDTRRTGSAPMQISYGKKGREGLETALRSEPRHRGAHLRDQG